MTASREEGVGDLVDPERFPRSRGSENRDRERLALPALAFWLGRSLGLAPLHFEVVLLFAALPTSTVAYVLAVRMGGDGRVTAAQVALSTLLSMVTLPLWLAVARY